MKRWRKPKKNISRYENVSFTYSMYIDVIKALDFVEEGKYFAIQLDRESYLDILENCNG